MGHFCVNCGAPLVPTMIEGRELEACPHDGFVLWRDPKVAAAVVVEADGGIVLGRRAIEPGYGLWCLPGGFVNQDEDPVAAALRECREEIGAAVEITELLGVYHIGKTTASSIVGIAYLGRLVDGEEISVGSEMLDVRVFAPDDLPEIAFPSHRSVLAVYLRSRERPVGPELLNVAAPAPPASPSSPGRARSRPPRRP
ncbi:MAG TPA: NUDIX domain-containing protein [Candidatus Dormibacteraeota bacterium]